jgi:hypothetical protein
MTDGSTFLWPNRERRKNFLYRNNRDGTFTRIAAGQIVDEAPDDSDSFGAAWGDYDNDGYLDLFVANCCLGSPINDFLYRNDGNGTFVKVVTGSVVDDQAFSFTGAWGDYDKDGFLDLFVTAWGPGVSHVNFLYRNNGDGTFAQILTGPVVTDSGLWSNGGPTCSRRIGLPRATRSTTTTAMELSRKLLKARS